MKGPLWYSGPGITSVPSGVIIRSGFASGSINAGAVLRIRFGRPVLPPEVIPFQGSDTVSRRASGSPVTRGGLQPGRKHADPAWSAGTTPSETFQLGARERSLLVGRRRPRRVGGREVGEAAGIRDHGHDCILTQTTRDPYAAAPCRWNTRQPS